MLPKTTQLVRMRWHNITLDIFPEISMTSKCFMH